MCGITGIISYTKDIKENKKEIKSMTETLTPRGPDSGGIYTTNNCNLGHRRLAVVDLIGGVQPMKKTIGKNTCIIVYNGELYNTKEVRSMLIDEGVSFFSSSDTEVVLSAYIIWGKNSLKYLNGIFAFGIWNENMSELFLARDRMGVKPLFYTIKNNNLIFASEIKAILKSNDFEAELDTTGIQEIIGLGPGRSEHSGVLKGIKSFAPGECGYFNKNGLKTEKYWQIPIKKHIDDFATTTRKISGLVKDAITRQTVSDVPLATFLSGGLDSSAISSIVANNYRENNKGRLKTFSVDYQDNEKYFSPDIFQPNSDNFYINEMSKYIGSDHKNIKLSIDELYDSLTDATLARDLPGMADIDSSLLLFSREIKKDVTVALSGECADEIFGGYPWFTRQSDLSANDFPWAKNTAFRESIINKNLADKIDIEGYCNYHFNKTKNELMYTDDMPDTERQRSLMFYLNIKWFMQTLLDRKDRMTMATGLEVRVPFCDHNIVEYAFNIPWEMKNYQGREKGLLREALKGKLPKEILWRKKSPYPKTHHPRYMELVTDNMRKLIMKDAPVWEIIDKSIIKKFVENKSWNTQTPWYGQLMRFPQFLAYIIQINFWLEINNINIISSH